MLCKLCLAHGRKNSFTSGCLNFRHSSFLDHLKTSDHKLARLAPESIDNNKKAVLKLGCAEELVAKIALKVVHWMIMEDLPLNKFSSLMKLLRELEVPNVDKLHISNNATYKSYESAIDFLKSLASSAEESLKSKLELSSTVTVLADESTDINTKKKLVIYAVVADKTLKPSTHFVTNLHCPDVSGEGIANSIIKTMSQFGVPAHKIMGFGSDGANVMTGRKKGATGMLLRHNPHMINVHCMAHRLALCTSQAADAVPDMKSYHETVTSLYYYFKLAPARVARFSEIQQLLDGQELRVREVHGVRWLSFFGALEVVFRSLDSLLTYFQENTDAKAVKLKEKIATTKFISITYLMMDIMPIVTRLCQFLQTPNLDIAQVQVKLSATLNDLELLLNSEVTPGHYQKLLKTDLPPVELDQGKPVWRTLWPFKKHEVSGCPPDQITATSTSFIKEVMANIKSRFPDNDFLSCFGILAMRPISQINEKELSQWGVAKLEKLLVHYGQVQTHNWSDEKKNHHNASSQPLINSEECLEEWRTAKMTVLSQDYP